MTNVRRIAAAPLLVWGLCSTGCIEERRELSPGDPNYGRRVALVDDPTGGDEDASTPENKLIEAAEEHPENPRGWWVLGEYYEKRNRFPEAIAAYTRLAETSAEFGKARVGEDGKLIPAQRFTAGDYHLGRCYAKARMYRESVLHLQQVLALQPVDPRDASTNAHYREAHFILGAVYYDNRQWAPAREHFEAFKAIGGEPERADPWLMRMDEQEWLVRNPPSSEVRRGTAPAGPRQPAPAPPPAPAPTEAAPFPPVTPAPAQGEAPVPRRS